MKSKLNRLSKLESVRRSKKDVYIIIIDYRTELNDTERIYNHGETITTDKQLTMLESKIKRLEEEYNKVIVIDNRMTKPN